MPSETTKKTSTAKPKTPKSARMKASPTKTKAKTATTKAKPKTASKPKTTSAKPKEPAIDVSMEDYEALLKRARDQIPPEVFDQPRFNVPKVDSFIQGARTVVRNFKDLTETLRRDPKHLLRYLSHELATASEIRSPQVIFNGRFPSRVLDELVKKYTEEYVVCPVCQRPDTEMRREDRLLVLVCSACGARTPLRG
ncbi:MAG: translation initiation factor IF-2 subunit beta [Promethearchaeota archaeon]